MKVIKVCIGEWKNSSHDKRELAVCRELGAEVQVIAKGSVSGQQEMVDGFPVIRLSARPFGNKVPVAINRVASLFTWASYIRKMNDVDVISGHDISGLLIGWMSNFFKQKKAKLVYDSHEFTVGRDELSGKLEARLTYYLEHFLIKRSTFSIMVNDTIADEVQKIHKLKERPVVAKNAAFLWELNQQEIDKTRDMINSSLGITNDDFVIMYHGAIAQHRGIEEMISAMTQVKDVYAIVLGNSETVAYTDSLKALAAENGIADRICFYPAVPLEELPNYVAAVNVGMINIRASSKSFYYMLPNKFFENIQGMTPIIVSDFPEVARITNQYKIGLTVNPDDIADIAKAIEQMKTDTAFYNICKENLKVAKKELCWENEKQELKEAYSKILF